MAPALDLALSLWTVWHASNMIHLPIFQPIGHFARELSGSVVTEQTCLVQNRRLIAARGSSARSSVSVTSSSFIIPPCALLPIPFRAMVAGLADDDVTAEVIQYPREIEPAQYLQISASGMARRQASPSCQCLVLESAGEGFFQDSLLTLLSLKAR